MLYTVICFSIMYILSRQNKAFLCFFYLKKKPRDTVYWHILNIYIHNIYLWRNTIYNSKRNLRYTFIYDRPDVNCCSSICCYPHCIHFCQQDQISRCNNNILSARIFTVVTIFAWRIVFFSLVFWKQFFGNHRGHRGTL